MLTEGFLNKEEIIMELSSRKRAVLAAVVKSYIETGEPVGSKLLTGILENAPSSATLRNELSELCELGLLSQPHTSAGRVPTANGLKLYIDALMSPKMISGSAKRFIDSRLSDIHCEPERIPSAAGQIISDLTGLPAVTSLISEHSPRVKKAELMPLGRHSVMLMLLTDDGRVRSRIFRMDSDFSEELVKCFYETAARHIYGRPTDELTKAYMQSVTASAGIGFLELMPLIAEIFEMAQEVEEKSLGLSGADCIYNICETEDSARRLRALVERGEPLISLLDGIKNRVGVIFGMETGCRELRTDTVIAAKYGAAGGFRGVVGVIGPNRMSYEQIIPSMEYISLKLTDLMNRAQKDMED